MDKIAFEIAVIAVLILINGIFAMAEMALVSAKKSRLRISADQGNAAASCALALAESPNRFLSTVQIGITLIGILAGAYGGASLASEIGQILVKIPVVGVYGQEIAFTLVVIAITFFSLVVGELVPKRLALRNPEAISRIVAQPMHWLSSFASPVVNILSFATEGVLRLLRVKEDKNTALTEEDLVGIVQEGLDSGVLHQAEGQMMTGILALDSLRVQDLMTPRPRMVWLSATDTHEEVWHKIVISHHSYFPVYEDNQDDPLGFVSVKSIYANLAAGEKTHLRSLISPALIVSKRQSAIQLLEAFKLQKKHIALVTDEYGSICGLVTLNDILEAIVGEFPNSETKSQTFLLREDGSHLCDALVGIQEVKEKFPDLVFNQEEGRRYSTLGGFVCEKIGHIPIEGESFVHQGYRFEIIDMDRQRVDKVLLSKIGLATGGSHDL